jgi:hypothetical protein
MTGFVPGDFTLINEGGGKFTARPVASLTKTVTGIPNSALAVVVLYANASSIERPLTVPSSTPVGLVLLAIALMAGGLWVMSSRRRVETA